METMISPDTETIRGEDTVGAIIHTEETILRAEDMGEIIRKEEDLAETITRTEVGMIRAHTAAIKAEIMETIARGEGSAGTILSREGVMGIISSRVDTGVISNRVGTGAETIIMAAINNPQGTTAVAAGSLTTQKTPMLIRVR